LHAGSIKVLCCGQAREKEALATSEAKAEEGDVDGAMLFAKQAETFAASYETTLKSLTLPDRTMTVCEVCGVFINAVETDTKRKAGPEPVSAHGLVPVSNP
jgi:RNA-binding protein Luc7-like 2